MTRRAVVLNIAEAELLAEALESLTDEQLAEHVGLTELLVAAALIAGERRFLR